MSPDEVIQKLKMLGVNSSRATLLRYKDAGLIPKPDEGAGGRGVGRFTDYPAETVSDYFASHHVIKGKHASQEQAAIARNAVKSFISQYSKGKAWDVFDETSKAARNNLAKMNGSEEETLGDVIEVVDVVPEIAGQGAALIKEIGFLLKTRFALEWWELQQISAGKIDENYKNLCIRIAWQPPYAQRGASGWLPATTYRVKDTLEQVLIGLKELTALYERSCESGGPCDNALEPLERWISLFKLYPEMQVMIRGAMLADYRRIPPSVFDLLTTGKLPEV